MKTTKRFAALGSALAALLLAGCGATSDPQQVSGGDGTDESIVVGSAAFAESEVVAELYAGALEEAGFDVSTKHNIGQREIYFKAIKGGTIDVIPDYSGNLLLFLNPDATVTSAEAIMEALPKALPDELAVLEPAEAEDKDSLVVTQATAEKYDLETIGDLAKVCDELVFGAGPEFAERAYGLPGLKENYGCVPKRFEKINDSGGPVTVKALISNKIQVADIFTTSPAIEDNDLVVLEDPKDNFLAQQVVPLVRKDAVNDKAAAALNEVSAELTTQDLVNLNRQVSGDQKRDPADAAEDWLQDHGIVEE